MFVTAAVGLVVAQGQIAVFGLSDGLEAAGWITLANTTGAMTGSLAAGFVLLPQLGMERSLLLLALVYGAVALCTVEYRAWRGLARYANGGMAVLFVVAVALFPTGSMRRFLDDFEVGLRAGRYIAGELPRLPFAEQSFQLALCSHFLFLYTNQLSEAFHVESVLELCRAAGEVRIFPLVSLDGGPSRRG